LAFLLDGLHEDLNRVLKKPYTTNPDYAGQPDNELAKQFFDIYLKRNQSIIVDLFAGQLKSTIQKSCGQKSVTFDPFTFLSLPLPIDDKRSIEVFFFHLNRQHRPIKVSILIDREEGTVDSVLSYLSDIVQVPPYHILLASVNNHQINNIIYPWTKLSSVGDVMNAYQLVGVPAAWEGHVAGVKKKVEEGGVGGVKEPSPKIPSRTTSPMKEKEKEKKGRGKGVKLIKTGSNKEVMESEKQDQSLSPHKKKKLEDADSEKDDTDSDKAEKKSDNPEKIEICENTEEPENSEKPDQKTEKIPSDSNSGTPGRKKEVKKKKKEDPEPKKKKEEPKKEKETPQKKTDIIYIRVLHRKIQRNKIYFMTPYSTNLFSSPTIFSFSKLELTKKQLYCSIADLLSWMVPKDTKNAEGTTSKKPTTKQKETSEKPDADPKTENDSESENSLPQVGSRYPFLLKYVNSSGTACSRSPWYTFNLGTLISDDDGLVDLQNDDTVAIDWKPDLYSLKYLRVDGYGDWYDEHPSCKENWDSLNKPISLDQCMNWFTQEEDLGDELFCSDCQKHEKTKKKKRKFGNHHPCLLSTSNDSPPTTTNGSNPTG